MSEYVARNGEHALFLTYIALGEKKLSNIYENNDRNATICSYILPFVIKGLVN
jgi:hypothetical protein